MQLINVITPILDEHLLNIFVHNQKLLISSKLSLIVYIPHKIFILNLLSLDANFVSCS